MTHDTNDTSSEQDDMCSSATHAAFHYKALAEHVRSCITHWKTTVVTAIASFGVFWGFAEASSFFLNLDIRNRTYWIILISLSIFCAMVNTVRSYLSDCPECLKRESRAVQKIAHLQRPKWEYHMAKYLLEDRLHALDQELSDILAARMYVPIRERLSTREYIRWAQVRPDNVLRMVEVAKHLIIHEFPKAVFSRKDAPADPASIVNVVDQIRNLYDQSLTFERENREIAPPAELQSLHSLQAGWTMPIRDSFKQLLGFLDQVIGLSPTEDSRVKFTVELAELPNADDFCQECNRLTPVIEQLLMEESP